MKESDLQVQVADYLRLRHPDVLFHSDFGSGIKLTPGQAVKQKRQNGGRRAWPDLFIAEPKTETAIHPGFGFGGGAKNAIYHGLFIELKKEGARIRKKNGEWASEHIAEQAEVLLELRNKGYQADFAVGFNEAIKLIDEYLGA
jgi:hypothetical protein